MNTGVDNIASLPGCELHYRRAGQGDPLVLLHPSGGVRVTQAVNALAERFTVFQPTFPGFDGTPLADEEASVVRLALRMAQFIERIVGGPALVAGHSFGGWVASWLAVQRPDLVRALVLQCPLGFGPLATLSPGATSAQALARTYTHPAKRVAETKPKEVLVQNRALAARYGRGVTEDQDLMQRMKALDASVLVVIGNDDGVVQRAGLEKLAQSAKHARLVVVDSAAHHVESDQPERYVGLIAEFASAHRTGASP